MKKVFTTGQVAKICKVAPRTVSKWFDSGRLRGYRIPGSQDRRIPREHLLRFLKEHGMPAETLLDEQTLKVLVLTPDRTLQAALTDVAKTDERLQVRISDTPFHAGLTGGRPHVLLLDFEIGTEPARRVWNTVQGLAEESRPSVIAIVPRGQDDLAPEIDHFSRPFDVQLLIERLLRILAERMSDA